MVCLRYRNTLPVYYPSGNWLPLWVSFPGMSVRIYSYLLLSSFNQLDLPEYISKEQLQERLLLAVHEANEGFGFGWTRLLQNQENFCNALGYTLATSLLLSISLICLLCSVCFFHHFQLAFGKQQPSLCSGGWLGETDSLCTDFNPNGIWPGGLMRVCIIRQLASGWSPSSIPHRRKVSFGNVNFHTKESPDIACVGPCPLRAI